jgi:hypothetical protein
VKRKDCKKKEDLKPFHPSGHMKQDSDAMIKMKEETAYTFNY